MILGSAGAGKSTLAVAMGERTGLPVLHLDVPRLRCTRRVLVRLLPHIATAGRLPLGYICR